MHMTACKKGVTCGSCSSCTKAQLSLPSHSRVHVPALGSGSAAARRRTVAHHEHTQSCLMACPGWTSEVTVVQN